MMLYTIDNQIAALMSTADETGILDEDVARAIEELAISRANKLESLAAVIRSADLEAVAVQAELDRLQAKCNALKNRSKWIKEWIFASMKANGETKVDAGMFKLGIQKNGGKQPMQVYAEPEDPPEWAVKTTIAPNNDEIRKRLEAGEELPFAKLLDRGEQLRVR